MYLDYAGSAIPQKDALNEIFDTLKKQSFVNPHTSNQTYVSAFREQICTLFNTTLDEYTPIFTQNATHAIKLVGDACPFTHFLYTKRNHNSILGLRAKSNISVSVLDDNFTIISTLKEEPASNKKLTLVAFPAECNLSGFQFDLKHIDLLRKKYGEESTLILLDAAKYVSTNRLDLSRYKPDLVPISLYKIVGYPTGLGVLLVRNAIQHKLASKSYFGGGTYDINIAEVLHAKPRDNFIERFEDGTIPFISICEASIALKHHMKDLDRRIGECHSITNYALDQLSHITHANGKPLVEIYNYDTYSVIAFNLINQDGFYIGYKDVEMLASSKGIKLRTGCCCNPGACAELLQLSTDDLLKNHQSGHKCWDNKDILHGRPTGVVRISFGLSSTYADVDQFVKWLKDTFISQISKEDVQQDTKPVCKEFWIYPIKSCPGIRATSWKITSSGFKYDRMFAIYDDKHKLVSIQKNPQLGTLVPQIDIHNETCTLTHTSSGDSICFSLISELSEYVHEWLSEKVGESVEMVKCGNTNFSNSSPFLILNEASLQDLNMRIWNKYRVAKWMNYLPIPQSQKQYICSSIYPTIGADRFRPNIVLDGLAAYEEDTCKEIWIDGVPFFAERECSRCYTTTINSKKQTRDANMEPMRTLLTYRKRDEGTMFGVYFMSKVEQVEQVKQVKQVKQVEPEVEREISVGEIIVK